MATMECLWRSGHKGPVASGSVTLSGKLTAARSPCGEKLKPSVNKNQETEASCHQPEE